MGSTLDDFQRFGDKLRAELDRIDQHREADQPYVRQYLKRVDGRVKESSLQLYLQNLRVVSRDADRPLVEFDRDYYDQLTFQWRHGERDVSDSTIRNYQTALRQLLDEIDVDAEWLEDTTVVTKDSKTLDPSDMLRAEDIRALCEAANNFRDIALIEFLADTGARIGLAGSLRVRDVSLDAECPTYVPNADAVGLKDAPIREYPLIDSRATLRTYLDRVHPRRDDDDVAFFHVLPGHGNDAEGGDGSISPSTVRGQLNDIAERAGVEKPTNPHNFRHSAISRMRREGYDRAEVEKRVCWTVDSDMWEIYEHIAAEEANRSMFERAGMIDADADDGESAERRRCGNCLEMVAPHHPRCPRCGEPIDPTLRELTETAEAEGTEQMAATEVQIQRLVEQAVVRMLRENDVQLDADGLGDVDAAAVLDVDDSLEAD